MSDLPAVKFVDENGDWFIEGLILPYGGPAHGNDLTGSHFTKSTDFCLDWFPEGGRPGLYAHGFDEGPSVRPIGREVKSVVTDKGVWLRAQIDKAKDYAAEVKQMAEAGMLSLSSGAVDHLTRIAAKTGEIQRWPWVEWSLVPNPANPEAFVPAYTVKSIDAVAHMGVIGTAVPDAMAEPGATPAIKAGARHSTADMAHIQSAHDAMAALGATCSPSESATATKTEAAPVAPEPAAMSFVGIKASELTANADDVVTARELMTAYAIKVATDLLR